MSFLTSVQLRRDGQIVWTLSKRLTTCQIWTRFMLMSDSRLSFETCHWFTAIDVLKKKQSQWFLCEWFFYIIECMMKIKKKVFKMLLLGKKTLVYVSAVSHFKLAANYLTLHKKWNFQLRVSSVNVTRSTGNCEFGHIYWRNPWWKTSFFMQC